MKHKFRTILLILVLAFGFMTGVNAETKIKEDADTYTGDVYIIGSSKFDSSVIVTGTMATAAGAREMQIQYNVYNNYDFDPADIRIYYYSELAESWSMLPVTSDDKMTELTEEETEKLTENLNIYFVNEVEKTIEMAYQITLEDGYELEFLAHNETYSKKIKYEDGKLILPASIGWFEIYAVKESETEGEMPEEMYLGSIEQSEGEFSVYNATVRTYEELEYALDNGTQYIVIEENIDFPTALEITRPVEIYIEYDVELTVKEDTAGDGVFHVLNGGVLSIYGDGTINGVGKNNYNMAIWADGGEVYIHGGTFTNVGAGEDDHYDLIYAKNGGTVTILGGYFECQTPKWTLNLKDSDGSEIIVKGGTFKDYNPAAVYTEPTQPLNFVANEYKVSEFNGEYLVSMIDLNDVALINGFAYQDLQEALNNANNGETVVLVNDVKYENCDTTPLLYQATSEDRVAVLDLNGYTISATLNNGKSIALLKVGSVNADKNTGTATLTIEDSSENMTGTMTITPTSASDAWTVAVETIIVERLGRLTVNGGNIITHGGAENADNPYGILVLTNTGPQTAELTINGGYIESKSPTGMGVRVAANSEKGAVKFTMNGGTIVGADDGRGLWLHHMAGSGKHQLLEVTINDGIITADRAIELGDFNTDDDVSENIKLTINGGEFNSTNLNGNTHHQECEDFFTGKSVTYYNQTFSHVKLTDNR